MVLMVFNHAIDMALGIAMLVCDSIHLLMSLLHSEMSFEIEDDICELMCQYFTYKVG